MRMWIHRVTIRDIVNIQKDNPHGVADSMYECIAAFRYWEAIELWFKDEVTKAQELVAKIRIDKFTDTERLLRVQARIGTTYRQQDPFTDTCVAAHQQRADWGHLVNGCDDMKLAKIKARHEMYKQCQHEMLPKEEAVASDS